MPNIDKIKEREKDSAANDLESAFTQPVSPIVPFVKARLDQAHRNRHHKMSQWRKNVLAVRGEDSQGPLRPDTEVDKTFIRTTNTKTRAAYAQIVEAILATDNFPISVVPTPVPEGIAEFAHIPEDLKANPEPSLDLNVGFAGDGVSIEPGATQEDVARSVLGNSYSDALDGQMFEEGRDALGTGVQLTPAKQAARKMEKQIQDQLEESKAKTELRRAIYEQCILGTGCMKGPFSKNKTINSWSGGQLNQEVKKIPEVKFVSLWDLYIDPNAISNEDIEWVIERHRLNLSQLLALKQYDGFDSTGIDFVASTGGNYQQRDYEYIIRDRENNETDHDLYEVLEYWGYMDSRMAKEVYQLNVPDTAGPTVQVNCWVSEDKLLKIAVNPFMPSRIPYFIFPYEEDPYSIYGVGVPELMEDLQYLMNGMVRLAVENAMLAGNVLLDVDENALASDEDMKVYPGKIFSRQHGAPGNAVNAVQIPFVAHQNLQMFSQFRQMVDETTGIQSILHGQTGISGTGRTASGLSLLLDSASVSIKNVIRNIDEYLLKPMARSYFQWNMQFKSDEHPHIVGDLEIRAMGANNLVSKERKAQTIQTFLQLSTNPQLAPFIRLPTLIKDLAVQLQIDPDDILNSPEESLAYVALQQQLNPQAQQGQGDTASSIGALPPSPGAPGFTGNNEGAGNVEGAQGQQPIPPV